MQKITKRNRSSSSVYKSGKFDSHLSNREIGKTIASDKFTNTLDDFWFMINPNVIINPFDFVSVENIYKTKAIGIVKHLQSSFIRSNYNDFEKEQKDKEQQNKYPFVIDSGLGSKAAVLARVSIMANTIAEVKNRKIAINFPVEAGKPVKYAKKDEIILALGIPKMNNPISIGIINSTDALQVPISLDISYVAGPNNAHVNASGIWK